MADDPTREAVSTAATWLGGTGVLAAIGVFIKGILNGSTGQEKDMREGLAERVAVLEARVTSLEGRLETANRHRDAWRWACLMARLKAQELAQAAGVVLPPWEDPKEDS